MQPQQTSVNNDSVPDLETTSRPGNSLQTPLIHQGGPYQGAPQGYYLTAAQQQLQAQNDRFRHKFGPLTLNFSNFKPKAYYITPKSFIFIVSIAQIIIYLITQHIEPFETIKDFPCALYKFGAKYTPAILTFHHFHRLILPIMLHMNNMHIVGNLGIQLAIGFRLEKFIGWGQMIFFYILCGLAGNLLSSINMVTIPSIGASSSILGLLGFYCVHTVKQWKLPETDNIDRFIGMFCFYNTITVFVNTQPGVDNAAHFGGFIIGLLLGLCHSQKSKETNKIQWNWTAKISLILAIVLINIGFFVLLSIPDHHEDAYRIAEMCDKKFPWLFIQQNYRNFVN